MVIVVLPSEPRCAALRGCICLERSKRATRDTHVRVAGATRRFSPSAALHTTLPCGRRSPSPHSAQWPCTCGVEHAQRRPCRLPHVPLFSASRQQHTLVLAHGAEGQHTGEVRPTAAAKSRRIVHGAPVLGTEEGRSIQLSCWLHHLAWGEWCYSKAMSNLTTLQRTRKPLKRPLPKCVALQGPF
jgi:hypothetical protein